MPKTEPQVKTIVYAPNAKRVTAEFKARLDPEEAIKRARAEMEISVAAIKEALAKPDDEWNVLVHAKAGAEYVRSTADGGVEFEAPEEEDDLDE